MKKIAIVGHKRTIEAIVQSITQQSIELEMIEIEFIDTNKNAALEYLKVQTARLDGIIFTGILPYKIINTVMNIELPQVYIEFDQSILQQALLEASEKKYDIKSFSCDAYTRNEIESIFSGFGVPAEALNFQCAPTQIEGDNLVWELFAYHKDQYVRENVGLCITGVSMVYEKLSELEIPSVLLKPTKDAVNNAIRKLLMKFEAAAAGESEIVVMAVEIDMPSAYNLIYENEYQRMLEKSKVSVQVYKFAETIESAAIEIGINNYMLVTTRKFLEAATDKIKQIPLLNMVESNTAHTVSIGIGYGKTARNAKYNASLSLNRSLEQGGNRAIYYSNGQYSESILPVTSKNNKPVVSDPTYEVISEKTGISINKIYKLHCIMEQMNKDCFTSAELSNAFNNSKRSMNRIIEKLEQAGYAEVVGNRMMTDTGRPSRVIKFKI